MEKLDLSKGMFEKERIPGEKIKTKQKYDYDLVWDEEEEKEGKKDL